MRGVIMVLEIIICVLTAAALTAYAVHGAMMLADVAA